MVKDPLTRDWRLLLRNRRFAAIHLLGPAVVPGSCLTMTGDVLHKKNFENGSINMDPILRTSARPQGGVGNAAFTEKEMPFIGPKAFDVFALPLGRTIRIKFDQRRTRPEQMPVHSHSR